MVKGAIRGRLYRLKPENTLIVLPTTRLAASDEAVQRCHGFARRKTPLRIADLATEKRTETVDRPLRLSDQLVQARQSGFVTLRQLAAARVQSPKGFVVGRQNQDVVRHPVRDLVAGLDPVLQRVRSRFGGID